LCSIVCYPKGFVMKKSTVVTILALPCFLALVLTCVQPKGDLARNNPLDPSSSNYQPPIISAQPQPVTVSVGDKAVLSVAATGSALSYQWQKDGVDISGATSDSLVLTAALQTNQGNYGVIITNAKGRDTSSVVSLTVNPTLAAPVIVTQPQSLSVLTGQSAMFTIIVTGTAPLAYQWKDNGTDIAGATSSTFSVATAQVANAGTYTVVVSNSSGTVVSAPATLTVTAAAVTPTIVSQPQSQTVMTGQSITLAVSATGTGTLSYQWEKEGADISGATANTYSISNVQNTNAGTYTVAVTNSVGSVTSLGAVITVSAAPVAPSIAVQPQSQTVTAGQNVTFSVTATGTGQLSYQWKENGTNISGATASSYSISNVQSGNAGTFTVVVSNSVGNSVSNDATLTVTAAAVAPAITVQPASQTITAGQSVTFSVTATGTAPLSYQWEKDGTDISGATANSFSITNVQNSNAGTYSVTVSNSTGNAPSTGAVLTVTAAPVPPTISSQPQSQTVTAGQSITFTVVASGAGTLSYQWEKNGAAISGATASRFTLSNVQSGNAGTYAVVVTNSAGTDTSSGAVLTVNPATVAPSIITQPQSQTLTAGSSVEFSVAATGTAPLSFQWYVGGTAISGATLSTYTISNVQAANAGTYTVMVSNGTLPNATSNGAVLTVNAATLIPPSLTAQPQSQTVLVGQSVTFSVSASGSYPLSYQWYVGGIAISGATSSTYIISNVQVAQSGTYTVMVSNGTLPNATSNGAVLTVTTTVAPSITTQPQSQTVAAGQSVTFSVSATGTAPLSYQWYKDGATISGATSSSYSISNVQTANAGTYVVTVSDGTLPNATSNGVVLSVAPATFTDIDGNLYHTVIIGSKIWMVENLKTTKYNDGTAIPLVTDQLAWHNLTTPGYCWYNNDAATYKNTYGALYNWYTVNTGNLAPAGWHIATDSEWNMGQSIGGSLKDTGTAHWLSPNTGATNSSGFAALPGGHRYMSDGNFNGIGSNGDWWSSTAYDAANSWESGMSSSNAYLNRTHNLNANGYSVRCVKN
jgi:uncharacterized protein (TIGR02145 family)